MASRSSAAKIGAFILDFWSCDTVGRSSSEKAPIIVFKWTEDNWFYKLLWGKKLINSCVAFVSIRKKKVNPLSEGWSFLQTSIYTKSSQIPMIGLDYFDRGNTPKGNLSIKKFIKQLKSPLTIMLSIPKSDNLPKN